MIRLQIKEQLSNWRLLFLVFPDKLEDGLGKLLVVER